MEQAVGVKDTKEVVKAILELVKVSADLLKDGAQVQDLIAGYAALAGDPVKKAALEAALQGIGNIPAEVKDINLAEGIELLVAVAQELPGVLAAFKKA